MQRQERIAEPQLEQVLELAGAFLAPTSLLGALDQAMVALLRLADARRGFASLPGVERVAFEHVEEELVPARRRRLERMAKTLVTRAGNGRAIVLAKPAQDPELAAQAEDQPVGPLLCVPMEANGERGALYLERDAAAPAFGEDEQHLVARLGAYLLTALPAARAAEEQRRGKQQLDLLNRLYESLSRSLELEEVLDMIAQVTLELTGAERAFILLMAGTQLYFGAGRDANGTLPQQSTRDISRSVARKVVETGEGLFVYDMADDSEFGGARSVVSLQINSVVAVPLRSQAGLTGVLYVDSRSRLMTALEQKLEVLTSVSHVASLAVESAKLYRQATVDGLTGMYVRTFFMLRLEEELRRATRYGRTFSLLVMDVDRFKTVNDTHGHQVGDDVLAAVSEGVRRSIRAGVDVPGRYGGDELVLLLPETNVEGAKIVAERIRAAIEGSPLTLPSGATLGVTLSIGIASPGPNDTASQLFAHADEALYAAKHAGRNGFKVYGG